MRRIKVLHFMTDDKFFDGVFRQWESDDRLENRAVFVTRNPKYQFQVIQEVSKVTILSSKRQIIDCLTTNDYDILFFQPFSPGIWPLAKYIPKEKVVIWWGFGMELYQGQYGQPPLLQINLYKPHTQKLLNCSFNYRKFLFSEWLKGKILYRHFDVSIKEMLARIDYYMPVIEDEYTMLKTHQEFLAKEFYYFNSKVESGSKYSQKKADGNILFGNNANYTNNHLDVCDTIEKFSNPKQKILLPINYGYSWYKDYLFKRFINKNNYIVLNDFLPREEYFSLIDDCSYAVFGIMRQQALGNVWNAIRKGIKLFFYKDSMLYKYLTRKGFYVYSIEDIDATSFHTPLTAEQNSHHQKLMLEDFDRRQTTYNNAIIEIQKRLGLN